MERIFQLKLVFLNCVFFSSQFAFQSHELLSIQQRNYLFTKTFKLQKNSTNQAMLSSLVKSTLGNGNLSEIVKLPKGESTNEWIACNITEFHRQLKLLSAAAVNDCDETTCPVMSVSPKWEFYWSDGLFKRSSILWLN
jgi:hypothetical protein